MHLRDVAALKSNAVMAVQAVALHITMPVQQKHRMAVAFLHCYATSE